MIAVAMSPRAAAAAEARRMSSALRRVLVPEERTGVVPRRGD